MPQCEMCECELTDDDEYHYLPVVLGDGSIDDEFFMCNPCWDEGEEQMRKDEDEYYEEVMKNGLQRTR